MKSRRMAEYRHDERGRRLTVGEARSILDEVPPHAVLTAIIHDFGTQRDPEPTFVGLRAEWEVDQ